MFDEVLNIRVAPQEPEQFVDNGLDEQFLGSEQREALSERKARLRPKQSISPRAGAIALEFSVIENQTQKLMILQHIWRRDCCSTLVSLSLANFALSCAHDL